MSIYQANKQTIICHTGLLKLEWFNYILWILLAMLLAPNFALILKVCPHIPGSCEVVIQ